MPATDAQTKDSDTPQVSEGEAQRVVLSEDYALELSPDTTGVSDFHFRVVKAGSSDHVGEGTIPAEVLDVLTGVAKRTEVVDHETGDWTSASDAPKRDYRETLSQNEEKPGLRPADADDGDDAPAKSRPKKL